MVKLLNSDITSKLKDTEFHGTNFFWIPEFRNRAERLEAHYSDLLLPPSVIRYVWEGGARDMHDFVENYSSMFEFRIKNSLPLPAATAQEYKESVRKIMEIVALDEAWQFLYCPFMKVRANDILSESLCNSEVLTDALCFISQEVYYKDFRFTEKHAQDRDKYLRDVGIILNQSSQ